MTGTLRLSNRTERCDMAYERIEKPEGSLYHYTKRAQLDSILQDDRIRRFGDRECWFCTSLESGDAPRQSSWAAGGGQEFSQLKVGFRGDLKFKENPEVLEVTPLLEQNQQPRLSM